MESKNGYKYEKQWFQFADDNPEKIKPVHAALYWRCVSLNNRLKWVEKFGLPTYDTMRILGIRNYKTYKKAFTDLEKWGLIKVIERSKNQYTSNIIALVFFTKASPKHCHYNKTKRNMYKTSEPKVEKININPIPENAR